MDFAQKHQALRAQFAQIEADRTSTATLLKTKMDEGEGLLRQLYDDNYPIPSTPEAMATALETLETAAQNEVASIETQLEGLYKELEELMNGGAHADTD